MTIIIHLQPSLIPFVHLSSPHSKISFSYRRQAIIISANFSGGSQTEFEIFFNIDIDIFGLHGMYYYVEGRRGRVIGYSLSYVGHAQDTQT